MEDIKSINLFFLKKKFRKKGKPVIGYRNLFHLIKDNDDKKLKRLLRNHKDSPIYGKEIEDRDNVDKLLFFYSLVEVAAIADYIVIESDENLVKEIKLILGNPIVRKYYEEYYPLILPQLILKRVNQKWNENLPGEIDNNYFVEFMHLNSTIDGNEKITLFLNFIDDIHYGGEGISDLNKILFNPELLYKHIQLKPKEQSYTDKALIGFFGFLNFMKNFEGLLQRTKKFTLLQGAMWHFHSYWFEHIRTRMNNQIWKSLDNFISMNKTFSKTNYEEYIKQIKKKDDSEYRFEKESSNKDIPTQRELIKKANESIVETQKAFQRLLSNKYSEQLEKVIIKKFRIKKISELKNIPT